MTEAEYIKLRLECLRLANIVAPPSDVVIRMERYYDAVTQGYGKCRCGVTPAPDTASSGSPSESSDVQNATPE